MGNVVGEEGSEIEGRGKAERVRVLVIVSFWKIEGDGGEADPDIYRLGIISSIARSWLSIVIC